MTASKIQTALSLGCLLIAAAMAALVMLIAWQCQWAGPFRDYWEVMPLIETTFTQPISHWPWHELWAPYGGAHRLVIPKLLFIADFHTTGGSNRLILSASILCLMMAAGLIIRRVQQCYGATPMLYLASAISLVTLFSATQLFNLNYSYDTQWFQVTGLSVLALYLASHTRLSTHYWPYAVAAMAAGTLASLSNMAGFLVWPPLGLLLWCAAHNTTQRLTTAVITLCILIGYLHGLHTSSTAEPFSGVLDILGWLLGGMMLFARFIPLYLGSPFTKAAPILAGFITAGALGWVLWQGWRARHRTQPQHALQLLLSAIAVQALLVAMATAWGRRYYHIDMAMADRYQAIAMLFWLAVGISILMRLQRRHTGLAIAMTATLTGALMPFQIQSVYSAVRLANAVQSGHLGLAMGFTEMHVAANTLSHPAIQKNYNYAARHNSFLQQHRLAYFKNSNLALIGTILDTHNISPSNCHFNVTYSAALASHNAQELNGRWQCPSTVNSILLIDRKNTVVGLLEKPLASWLLDIPWSGYVHAFSRPLIPVGIAPSHEARLIGSPLDTP
ncbi:MAG TPA: hypothetical protein VIM96_07085 [Pseudomonadales bacterium]